MKGTKPDVLAIAFSTQVKHYLGTYGIVIATNLCDFLIVTRDSHGAPERMKRFSLAENEQEFWRHTMAHPGAVAAAKGEVLDNIAITLLDKGGDALVASDLRVFELCSTRACDSSSATTSPLIAE